MTNDRTFKVLVVGELSEIDHIFEWEQFRETYPSQKVTVEGPDAFSERVADPEIDVVLVDLTPHGRDILEMMLEERPVRPVIMVGDPEQADMLLEAKERGLDSYVIRVDDDQLNIRMLAQELEGLLEQMSRPPSMERPGVEAIFEYAQYHNVRQPFFVVGPSHRMLYVNAAGVELCEQLHGERPHIGSPIMSCPLERADDQFREHLERAFGGEPVVIESCYREFPDSEQHRRVSYDPVVTPEDRVVAISITFENLGPRVEAEAKYERFEENLWHYFEKSPLPLKIVDREGVVERCNDAYRRLLGFDSAEEVEGKSIAELHHPDDARRGREALEKLLEEKEDYARVELRERGAPGRGVVWGDHIGFLLPSGVSDEPKAFIISLDVTRQKEAEQRAQRSVRMQALGELAGGVAHDFNNVLSVVGTVGHLLRRKLEVEGREEYLDLVDRIERAVDSGTSLTKQLMAFGREHSAERAAGDLNAAIEEVGQLLARTLGEHIDIQFDLDQTLAPVAVDAGRLQQVVMNLAVNARDAIRDEGQVVIATETAGADEEMGPPHEEGGFARLRISDDGIGMDEETLEHIFDPFFTTKTSEKGTGLGLATVFKIVDDAGGQIEVDSEPGEGTAFEIYLPTAPDAELERPRHEEERRTYEAPSETTRSGAGRILLVEDENDLREPYQIYLERSGHEVVAAGSYQEARTLFDEQEGEIDLVVADVVLPDGSGVDLVGEIRQEADEIGVVYVSGYAPDLVVERETANDDEWRYLRKPVGGDELVATVGDVLAEKAR